MCGIAGGYDATTQVVEQMLNRIAHRGPDGRGIHAHGLMVHGHVRLALVDLSDQSAQPFQHQGITLSFNGEIWNYRELRQKSPHSFKTTGDTEVLADTLYRHGLDGLSLIDGMYGIAFSDQHGNHFVARDPFGKIPLYIAKSKTFTGRTAYLYGSERKAFPKATKPIAVPPGYAFNLKTGEWIQHYKLPSYSPCSATDVRSLLTEGVNQRLHADAPVCCLISGGLDSSLILALAKQQSSNVTAFTASFDTKSPDLLSARRLCSDLSIPLIEVPVDPTPELINRAISTIEISSKAQIEIAILCLPLAERIAAEGYKACLSGEAADELFGGYGNFCIQASRAKTADDIRKLRHAQLAKMSRGNFVRCNKAFMAHGVECRLPFMQQALVERVINLDKIESPPGKKLLKQAAKNLVPDWIIKRQKETFQGASGIANQMQNKIDSPKIFYNNELRKKFGYLPKD